MHRLKSIAAIAAVATIFVSCGSKEITYNNECGPLKEFKVDKAYCQQYGLQEQSFKLQYPSDLEIETQEDFQSTNYVSFFRYDKDSVLTQGLNIGYYYGLTESGGNSMFGSLLGVTKESLLKNMINQFKAQGLEMHDVTMQDEEIAGEDHFTTRGWFETTEDMAGFKGKYLCQLSLFATSSDKGLLLIMTAKEGEGISSFKDFETKSCLAPILQSLD